MIQLFSNNRHRNIEVEPDEIFLDSRNLPDFNTQQFEGRIEKPISKNVIITLGVAFAFVGIAFMWQLSVLQISKGEAFYEKSEKNSLDKTPLFANRGVIYDRNGKELAWNKESVDGGTFLMRGYIPSPGFAHLLGYVSYPAKDKSGNYWQSEFIGKDGVEKVFNDKLKGVNGTQILETNARGEVQSTNITDLAQDGENLKLSIDAGIQAELYRSIEVLANQGGFKGGAAVMMNVENGELLALTNYPEYNSEVLSLGEDREKINTYFTDKRKILLNRVVSGLYTPGSIVKPFLAIGALAEGVITPDKVIYTTGSISIPNPYNKDDKTVFKDWKNHGPVDMRTAIAVSSDVYFYEIGGGFQDQKGMGIANIEKYSRMFGISEKTGINLLGEQTGTIPNPEWKKKMFKGDIWRVGDTYHTSIGQYGYQVTPLQMVRATAALANGGTLLTPHLLAGESTANDSKNIDLPQEYFKVAQEGMREAVTSGTASSINTPLVKIAAKTGTAQVGLSKANVHTWVIGYFPYENPKYAFTLLMENGPANNSTKAVYIMKNLLEWMTVNAPEYFQ
jgi:penicillin-binding protein 2